VNGPALAADQPLSLVHLVVLDGAALAAPQLPSGCLANASSMPCQTVSSNSGSTANRVRKRTSPPTRSARLRCGVSARGGSWSQCPHRATVNAARGARTSASGSMAGTALVSKRLVHELKRNGPLWSLALRSDGDAQTVQSPWRRPLHDPATERRKPCLCLFGTASARARRPFRDSFFADER
jgi:hypothetical protein